MNKKISKVWVTTHTRADGKKFYTAHIKLVSYLFWIIPIYYTYPIVEICENPFKCGMGNNEWNDGAYKFPLKTQAEYHLLEVIDWYLDTCQAREDAKIVKSEDNPVSYTI